ncbi:Fibrous sheath-interacting protein 2 [Habropoda laboriosa]|uniref:Fibrous sheath-interacting protein 2 n=1 Tax=Habropoda laboriosa TaxID=597456 RepID=A0A0L7R243_9HYME|nr:Fibrous sheath-interacting protein 2 [Habropoda laboriosa]
MQIRAFDKLFEAIPKPKGAIPNFGLPKWKVMPLESKIPMVPGPEGAYNFTRRKVGRKLWISAPHAEFNLSDPYGYEIKWTYDSLHDKHLVPYFSKPNIVRQLIKAGLITKDLDAKCSLRDYNMYRKYLRRLHCDRIKNELNKRTKLSIEERAIQYAQEQAEKEMRRLKERDRMMDLRSAIIREHTIAEKLKVKQQKQRQKEMEERLQTLLAKKREAQHLQQVKSRERAEMIQQKQKAAADIKRQKLIQTLLEWSKKERRRKRIGEIRLMQEQEEKRKLVEQKWEERQEFQKKQIEKEQFLLQCLENQREDFITVYNEKVNKETERMKKLFNDMKMYIQCYLARNLPGHKEQICCRKYLKSDENIPLSIKTAMKDDKTSDVSKLYASSSPEKLDKDRLKKERSKKKGMSRYDVQKKDITGSKIPLKWEKGKKRAKMQPKVKRKKMGTHKAGRGGKKKRKRKKRRKAKEEEADIESERKSELETQPESASTSKTGVSEASSDSAFRDRCTCQAIRDAKKSVF